MKYSKEIVINLPREEVITRMENPDNFKHWQDGFISYKLISGQPGIEGARAKLSYKMGKREIEMMETIIKNNLPDELHTTYDAKGVYNIQKNYFKEIDKNTTKWVSYNEFKFSGFMKLIGFVMPGIFEKQSLKYMQDFKAFAEEGKSVCDN
jgi:chaperonin GroEL (HSP60 family)